jgi:pimeloyl-ACP methyl ester carboxylesterase
MLRLAGFLTGVIAAVLCAACSSGADPSARNAGRSPAVSAASTPSAQNSAQNESRPGMVDIGGRSLYLTCTGTGKPTVIYLHGLGGTHASVGAIPTGLRNDVRVCTYDRANVGRSDQQEGQHTSADSVEDLRLLLEKAGIDGPYVFLGASFGGLLALQYSGTYPQDVAGLVLLDAALPAFELVNQLISEDQRGGLIAAGNQNQERVDLYESLRLAQGRLESVPDVPVIYLAARMPQLPAGWQQKQVETLVRQYQHGFINRFSQGRLEVVDAPHHMEPVIPDKIVAETRRIVELVR